MVLLNVINVESGHKEIRLTAEAQRMQSRCVFSLQIFSASFASPR